MQENIGRFKISMNDLMLIEIFEPINNIFEESDCLKFW